MTGELRDTATSRMYIQFRLVDLFVLNKLTGLFLRLSPQADKT